jgi:tetratricopeptide (TPR) repeat protein
MRKTLVVAIGLAALLTLLFAACSSTPEPVPPPDEVYDQAKALRSTIQEYDLAQYSQSAYDRGEAAFKEGETQYNAEQFAEAETSFNEAVDNYRTVVDAGFRAISTSRKSKADDAKSRADGLKARVALPDDYQEAQDVYDEAVAAAAAGDDQKAAELFENAETLFEQVYQAAAEKKRLAEEAVGNAGRSLNDLDTKRQELEDEARADLATDTEEGE